MGWRESSSRVTWDRGLEERLAAFYERDALSLARFAYVVSGDHGLAEDLVHEAFLRVLARFRQGLQTDALHLYLRTTVINLYKSFLRKKVYERRYVRHVTATAASAPGEMADYLHDALLRLPLRQRSAIFFRYYEDLTYLDVAHVLGCSESAAKSLVARGLRSLEREPRERVEGRE